MSVITDKVELANRALRKLGAQQISGFDDNSQESAILEDVFDQWRKSILTKSDWRFASKQDALVQSGTDPEFGYKYKFDIPDDMLKLRALYVAYDDSADQSGNNLPILTDYKVFDAIHVDYENIWAEYLYDADYALWPAWFVEFAVSALAYELAMPITRDTQLSQLYRVEAYGETSSMMGGLFAEATNQDTGQQPTDAFKLDIFTRSRFY